ncbi:MAG: glycerophosphodiester phosphodiesterase family protein, partial [Clostridia bacterium]|nr:glycerophosphodiester phosphodiesterase family protein [Clostridia bacterium]
MKLTQKLLSAALASLLLFSLPVSAAAADIRFPEIAESNVFTAPTLITEVDTKAELDALSSTLPTTAVFTANDSGDILFADGTVAGTPVEISDLCGSIIPAFEVSTEAAMTAVTDKLDAAEIRDFFIVSENNEILHTAIDKSIWCRTVLRVTDAYKTADGSYDLMKIRGDANSVGCHVVILPEEISDRYHADYLERRLVGVWTTAPATEYGNMAAILSGGNGIITKDIPGAKTALAENFEKNTMTRQILIVGHRGMPGSYPENTIEGSLFAIEAGADIVENDIYITKDGVIVAMHDGDISRTTNGAGNVESFTLAELKEFLVDTHSAHTDWRIPTLEEYFIEWKKLDKTKQLFVEIKSGKAELIDEFIRLVKEYDIADQVSVITFSQDQIIRLHEAFPEMSIGFLTSGLVNGVSEQVFKSIIRSVQKLETTFNHNLDGITKDYFAQLNAHGITQWPWTYRDQSQFIQHFLTGINGMTTDYSNWIGETVKYCYTGEGLQTTELTLTEGETLENDFRTMTYSGTDKAGGEIKVVSGDCVTSDGNTLTATAAGEAYIYATYTTAVVTKPIRATSDLIKVTVNAKPAEAVPTEAVVDESPA